MKKYIKAKIIRYDSELNFFVVKQEDGAVKNLDLFTNSTYRGFGRITNKTDFNNFVGKDIEYSSVFPWIEFARNVKLNNKDHKCGGKLCIVCGYRK